MFEAKICEPGGKGLVLPFDDYSWPRSLRAVLYAFAMVYSFLGVAIVADIFMSAIEAVTKRRKRKRLKSGTVVTVYVWNDTVANLSLMALGSSAPEIFLSLIDLLRTGFRASDLGSATIVGSAAFNLLVIIAVCIMSIPGDETRLIEQYSVFIVTGIFSLFAYLWLAFILVVWTPNVVEIWEALATLLLLPVLIWVSYIADIGKIACGAALIIGHEAIEEAENMRSSVSAAKRFSRASGAATVSSQQLAASESSATDGNTETKRKPQSEEPEEETKGLKGKLKFEPSTTFSLDVADIDEGTIVKGDVRSVGIKRLSRNSSSSDKRSEGSDPASKKRASWKTKQLTRGFSMASDKSEIRDETTATNYKRRKSIAAHHNQAVKRFVKKGAAGAQMQLGSTLSVQTTATAASSKDGEQEEEEYRGSSAEIQFFIDRVFVSPELATKTFSVLRMGTPAVRICVSYSVHKCQYASERLQMTRVQCAKHPPPLPRSEEDLSPTLGDGEVVEWLKFADAHQVFCGKLVFEEDAREKLIEIENPWPSSGSGCFDYIVSLDSVELEEIPEGPAVTVDVGRIRSMYVMSDPAVIPEMQSGMFSWGLELMEVQGRSRKQQIEVVVVRHGGCLGEVSVAWKTEALTAVADVDYVEAEGVLHFEEGCSEMTVPLTVLHKSRARIAREFLVVLTALEEDPNDNEPRFNPCDDGGEDSAIITIRISERRDAGGFMKKVDWLVNVNHLTQGFSEWKDGVLSSIFPGGSMEDMKEASVSDWIFHLMALPWTLFFALVPPTIFFGGWACFIVCLIYIGAVTGIVADLAELFGCVCDLPDIITAISFVALGTSMPDLFASKVAAQEDPTADASIVNVTGSNSVNVFLGLGLPWTLAAIYWNLTDRHDGWVLEYPDVALANPGTKCVFAVPSANLGFSIVSFCCACFGAITLLVVRRRSVGGELGGPHSSKVSSSVVLVAYWLGYVAIVSWRALRYGTASGTEEMAMCGGLFVVECGITFIPLCLLRSQAKQRKREREERKAQPEDLARSPSAGFRSSSQDEPSQADGRGPPGSGDMPAVPEEPAALPFAAPITYKSRPLARVVA